MKKIIYLISISLIFSQVTSDISFNTSKSLSLAGAVVSDPGTIESVFYNPAGISRVNQSELIIGNTNFYNQSFLAYNYASYIFYNEKSDNVAITVQNLSVKSDYSDNDDWLNPNDELTSELCISLSQGFDLLNDKNSTLSIGYSLNYLRLNQGSSAGVSGNGIDGLSESSISSVGIDIGVLSSLRDKVVLGAYIKNINSPHLSKGPSLQYLPRKLSIGITYLPFAQLKTNFQIEKLLGSSDNQFRFGIEYELNKQVLLRTGIQMKPNRYGMGFSYMPNDKMKISFGMLTHPVLSTSNNFDISIYF